MCVHIVCGCIVIIFVFWCGREIQKEYLGQSGWRGNGDTEWEREGGRGTGFGCRSLKDRATETQREPGNKGGELSSCCIQQRVCQRAEEKGRLRRWRKKDKEEKDWEFEEEQVNEEWQKLEGSKRWRVRVGVISESSAKVVGILIFMLFILCVCLHVARQKRINLLDKNHKASGHLTSHVVLLHLFLHYVSQKATHLTFSQSRGSWAWAWTLWWPVWILDHKCLFCAGQPQCVSARLWGVGTERLTTLWPWRPAGHVNAPLHQVRLKASLLSYCSTGVFACVCMYTLFCFEAQ